MSVIPEGHVETIDQLIDMMAQAISPFAFSSHSSEAEKAFARAAAKRALEVCAPIILTEAAAAIENIDGGNKEAVQYILGLRTLF